MLHKFAIVMSAAGLVMTVACSKTDTGVTSAVKSKLAADDQVKASEVNVDTGKHVVTLNGTVASTAEKERAEAIAHDTKGVSEVIDDLRVNRNVAATTGRDEQKADDSTAKAKTKDAAHETKVKTENGAAKAGDAITDAAVTTAVKTKFLAEPGVSGLAINVDTNNGVVTLTGDVKTKAEAAKAVAVARKTSGVKRVVNHLHVA